MAEGKASQEWDHTAFLAAWMGSMWGKTKVDPLKIHPYAGKVDRRQAKPKVHPVIFVQMLAGALGAKKV